MRERELERKSGYFGRIKLLMCERSYQSPPSTLVYAETFEQQKERES